MAMEPSRNMDAEKLKRIKAVTFDVDGVFTDGGLLAMPDGDLLRVFDAKDSFAVRMAKMNGFHTGIITGASSYSIVKRFSYCGVDEDDIYLHSRVKMEQFGLFCNKYGLDASEVMYFGDDIPDVAVLMACGMGVAPADAADEAKDAADFVSPYPGGKGCVRHAIEYLLKSRSCWQLDEQLYKKLF